MRIKYKEPSELMRKMSRESYALGEANDCSVKSLAILTELPYETVRDAFTKAGRSPGDGTFVFETIRAAKLLGFELIKLGPSHETRKDPPPDWVKAIIAHYPFKHRKLTSLTTYHPSRFHETWGGLPDLLLESKYHHAAFKDGVVHDWSANHACRITNAYQIIKIQQGSEDQKALDVPTRRL